MASKWRPFVKLIYAPAVTCVGFQAPFNNPISLRKKSKRAIPPYHSALGL
jgi:hypothetical protein